MRNVWILLMLGAILNSGCEPRKGPAIGGDDQIIVFADSTDWNTIQYPLKEVFERVVYTPQDETEFYLQRAELSNFDLYKTYKYILMVGTLNSRDPVSQTVQGMLSDEVRPSVESCEYFVFNKKNEWARGQLVMILVSTNLTELMEAINENQEALYQQLDDHKNRIVSDFIYSTAAPLENKTLRRELFEKYHWTMRVHPDFKLREEDPARRYVRFHSAGLNKSLQRWISVYWEPAEPNVRTDTLISRAWMIKTRNKIGSWFVDSTVVSDYKLNFRKTRFADYDACCLYGIWVTPSTKNAYGGPFRSYAFADSLTRRVYFIDQAVFFPEEIKKLKQLRELDVITKTFTTQAYND